MAIYDYKTVRLAYVSYEDMRTIWPYMNYTSYMFGTVWYNKTGERHRTPAPDISHTCQIWSAMMGAAIDLKRSIRYSNVVGLRLPKYIRACPFANGTLYGFHPTFMSGLNQICTLEDRLLHQLCDGLDTDFPDRGGTADSRRMFLELFEGVANPNPQTEFVPGGLNMNFIKPFIASMDHIKLLQPAVTRLLTNIARSRHVSPEWAAKKLFLEKYYAR